MVQTSVATGTGLWIVFSMAWCLEKENANTLLLALLH
jgi:hypothetical protein